MKTAAEIVGDPVRVRAELVGIQMLRGVAASMVVFHHALEESMQLFSSGTRF
jgi:hypothetical protein